METTGLATHLKRVCELYSPLPQVALVNVYVNDKPGNLNFDKDEYAAIIRSELRKNNLEVITEIAKDSPYYLIRFDISELIIENDIRSAYGIAFSVGLVDAIAGARAVYEESTFGVAGTKSDYPTTIRSALSGWIIKASDAIAQRNEINKGLLVFLRDASANELTKERNDKLLAYFNDQGRSGSPDPGPSPLPPGAPNADDKSKSSVTGTGFLISKNPLVVTNHHVILGAKKISLFKAGEGTGIPAKVLAIDEVNDLAILTTVQNSGGFTDIEPLQLGSAVGVRIGDEVTTYGYPLTGILGEGVKFSNGVINALSGPANNTALFQISVPIQPGNSGGPLLDAAGKVRGVVVSQLNARWALSQTGALPQNVNFAIKIDYVRVLLTANQLDNLLANVPGAKVNAEKAIVRIHCER
jgi:S1-C subfamily serine protease